MAELDFDDSTLVGLKHLLESESSDGRALAQNLEDNPICSVTCDKSVPCFLVQWKGYATSLQIRFIHECLIRLAEKYQIRKILGDDSALATIHSDDQNWIVEDWMPRALAVGLKAAASKRPNAYFGQISVQRVRSVAPSGFAIQSFETLNQARDWLRGIA